MLVQHLIHEWQFIWRMILWIWLPKCAQQSPRSPTSLLKYRQLPQTPHQRVCPWTPLGTKPSDPLLGSRSRARHEPSVPVPLLFGLQPWISDTLQTYRLLYEICLSNCKCLFYRKAKSKWNKQRIPNKVNRSSGVACNERKRIYHSKLVTLFTTIKLFLFSGRLHRTNIPQR